MTTTTNKPETEKQRAKREALEQLARLCPPGSTVYTVLRHVSPSGMTRWIDCYALIDNDPQWLSGYIARAGIETLDRNRDSLKVSGAGMDMGFHVVYNLARTLYADSFDCIGEGCPSNDHSNGDRDYTPHRHSDGGYALRHRWM